MTQNLEYIVVNSFSEKIFGGNPASVFTNANGLDCETMQRLAKQMNLVESTFVFSSSEVNYDYYFRYFTPTREVTIAGHPTIAAMIALIESNQLLIDGQTSFRIKTNVGINKVEVMQKSVGVVVMMEQESPSFLEVVEDRKQVANVLGIEEEDLVDKLPIQAIHTGLGHLIVPVKSLNALMRVKRNISELREMCSRLGVMEAQVFTFETYNLSKSLHTRNICPREGIEDPACGVGNGALGAYLMKHYYTEERIEIFAEQGYVLDMPSVIEITGLRTHGEIKISIGGLGKVMQKGIFILE